MRSRSFLFALLGGCLFHSTPAAAEPPAIAPSDALSPTDERKAFTVPEGFEVQLVASEPDIQKPIQMAFDARGRLWVTTSHHYPFAAPEGKATDKLFVLSDFDPATGKARKVQVFASDLNIPIGVLPLPDCKSCIVTSIGEIRKYTDTDDDGKADKMEVLYTGFGSRDTHGMFNSYTLMPDGWVYACHGYLNSSRVKGKDGHEVEMQSGNTFRFRPDGSRIEVYTRGQVNPFGIAVDPWFNLYTADCHSKPITMLIPGAYYDSFGKPHDGLGFAPHVTRHGHGSTALCGLSWYDANHFPKEYKGTMFLGNVVTSRINFDRIEWKGATPVGIEQPDFLSSKDPWFRPTDIKLGPDGALYVADFYNKIIGHYEVDLKHPQRDKDRGRVWRIVWKGKDGSLPNPALHRPDFTKANDKELLDDLIDPNQTVRMFAGQELLRRVRAGLKPDFTGGDAAALIAKPENASRIAGWIAFLAEAEGTAIPENYRTLLDNAKEKLKGKLTHDDYSTLFMRALASRPEWGEKERALALDILRTFEAPRLTLVVVESMGMHPNAEFVRPLMEVLRKCQAEDVCLRHATRIALRNCLRDDQKALFQAYAKEELPVIVDIALAISTREAASFLFEQVQAGTIPEGQLPAVVEHIGRQGVQPAEEQKLAASLTEAGKQAPMKADALLALFRGTQSRGRQLGTQAVQSIIASAQHELGLVQALSGNEVPDAARTARIQSALRVLAALPLAATPASLSSLGADEPSKAALAKLVKGSHFPTGLRIAAADVMLRYSPPDALTLCRQQLADPATPEAFRSSLLMALASSGNKEARLDAIEAIKNVPYRTALDVCAAMSSTQAGVEELLAAAKKGQVPPRILQERLILERMRAARVPNLDQQIAELTHGLPPADQRLAELIRQRGAKFAAASKDKELGAKLFTKHCGACHRIADQGGKIAPQLDGIGIRGVERLLEDVLDPNRNVDQAFRARIITTRDERTITGLVLRTEGKVLVLADTEGKEIRLPLEDIDKNRETMLSPMPANFGDVISEAEFYHLLAYLLEQRAKELPKK
jgi:putative heme-binding domain-containing protein